MAVIQTYEDFETGPPGALVMRYNSIFEPNYSTGGEGEVVIPSNVVFTNLQALGGLAAGGREGAPAPGRLRFERQFPGTPGVPMTMQQFLEYGQGLGAFDPSWTVADLEALIISIYGSLDAFYESGGLPTTGGVEPRMMEQYASTWRHYLVGDFVPNFGTVLDLYRADILASNGQYRYDLRLAVNVDSTTGGYSLAWYLNNYATSELRAITSPIVDSALITGKWLTFGVKIEGSNLVLEASGWIASEDPVNNNPAGVTRPLNVTVPVEPDMHMVQQNWIVHRKTFGTDITTFLDNVRIWHEDEPDPVDPPDPPDPPVIAAKPDGIRRRFS